MYDIAADWRRCAMLNNIEDAPNDVLTSIKSSNDYHFFDFSVVGELNLSELRWIRSGSSST